MVDEHAGELAADRLGEQRGADGGVHAAAQREEDPAVPDLLAQRGGCGLAVALHGPSAAAAADLEQKVMQQPPAELRVGHFGVELHAVEPARGVFHRGAGTACGLCDDGEARRDRAHIVRVAHPADALRRNVAQEWAVRGFFQRDLAVFADAPGGADLPARHPRHQLVAVADAEHRHAEVQNGGVEMGRGLVINAVGPAGEDDAGVALGANGIQRDLVVAADLREDVLLADAAGDELVILPAEVQHKNFFHSISFSLSVKKVQTVISVSARSTPASSGRSDARKASTCAAQRPV